MRSGIAALVVSRESGDASRAVLDAVDAQTLPPDSILLLDCSAESPEDAAWSTTPEPANPEEPSRPGVSIIPVPGASNLGDAISRALELGRPELDSARWWWILHEDSIPEDTCLAELWTIADQGRTIGCVGPKQLTADGSLLLELGIHATRSARRLERVAPGEIDQGQYDSTSDVLAVGTAGMLLDPAAWRAVGGTDPILGPFGDGLDLGRRLHRAGFRVVAAPKARLRHERASLAPSGDTSASFEQRRFAQLYNWAKAVPAPLLPLLALWLLLWSPARALARTLTGSARLAGPELSAWARLVRATPALLGARRLAAKSASVPAAALRPLETAGRRIRQRRRELRRLDAGPGSAPDPRLAALRSDHARASGRSLLLVLLAALLLGAARWWGVATPLAGGAWTDLSDSSTELWDAAFSSWVPGGDGLPGPADPFLIPLALLTRALAPLGIGPDALALALLIASGPLAALTAWRFLTRTTHEPRWRALGALAWAVLPALTLSAQEGRLAPLLAHILLPLAASAWTSLAGKSAPLEYDTGEGTLALDAGSRSGAPFRFALVSALIVACVPWMLLVLLGALLVLLASRRRGPLVLLAILPAAILIAPSTAAALTRPGGWRALLTPAGPDAPSSTSRALLVLFGLPASGPEPIALGLWAIPGALLLIAALALLSRRLLLAPPARTRPTAPAIALAAAATLILAAVAARGIEVGAVDSRTTSVWIAPLLSLAALALLAVIADSLPHRPLGAPKEHPAVRIASAGAALLLLAGGAAPTVESALASLRVEASASTALASERLAPSGPLVAAVSAQAESSSRAGRVLVLDGDAELSRLEVDLWRGAGPSILDSTPLTRALALESARAGHSDAASDSLRELALTLVVYPDEETVRRLAEHDVDTILVRSDSPAEQAIAQALDRAPGLEKIGDTDAGALWRLRPSGLQVARARISTGDTWTPLESSALSVSTTLPEGTSGTLILAERADPGWTALLDGRELDPVDTGSWQQAFTLEGSGALTLVHETPWRLPWMILFLLALGASAIGAVPWRRIA